MNVVGNIYDQFKVYYFVFGVFIYCGSLLECVDRYLLVSKEMCYGLDLFGVVNIIEFDVVEMSQVLFSVFVSMF